MTIICFFVQLQSATKPPSRPRRVGARFRRIATADACCVDPRCSPQPHSPIRPRSFYNKGKHAEARQNYEEAYELYKQAYDLKPTDMRYRAAFNRTRFLAAASYVHRGQKLRDDGKLEEALAVREGGTDRSLPAHRAAGDPAHARDDRSRAAPPPAPPSG